VLIPPLLALSIDREGRIGVGGNGSEITSCVTSPQNVRTPAPE
jgi:hypothetical protein